MPGVSPKPPFGLILDSTERNRAPPVSPGGTRCVSVCDRHADPEGAPRPAHQGAGAARSGGQGIFAQEGMYGDMKISIHIYINIPLSLARSTARSLSLSIYIYIYIYVCVCVSWQKPRPCVPVVHPKKRTDNSTPPPLLRCSGGWRGGLGIRTTLAPSVFLYVIDITNAHRYR